VFGFLKKKLKEGIDKITKTISEKEEKKIEEAVEEVKKEEQIEEPKKELVEEVEKEIEAEIKETPSEKAEVIEEKLPELEKKIVEDIEKKVKEEIKAEEKIKEAKEVIETTREIEQIDEERLYEKEELFEKKAEEKLIAPEEVEVAKEEEVVEKTEPQEKKKGLLGRLFKRKPKVEKPVEERVDKGIIEKIKKKITEKKIEEEDVKDILKDLEMSLISSDVALEASEKIINDLRSNLVGNFIKRGEIENVVKKSFKDSITEILKVEGFDLLEKVKTKKPFLIVFLGFNGSGKTTSIARIGHLLKKDGLKCVFAAADCFRAASIEQLEEHGRNLGIEVIKHDYGADPAAVIFDAVKHAKAKDIDVVLADTAGRSHANLNLMDELKKIIRVNNPDLKILVLDALTGNDIFDQCKLFNDAVGVDGLILTKADVYEKGGAAISASFTIKKPILYLGVGQEYENLEKFDSDKIVEKLLE
jgi:fused signal recognition particle receptor